MPMSRTFDVTLFIYNISLKYSVTFRHPNLNSCLEDQEQNPTLKNVLLQESLLNNIRKMMQLRHVC